MSTERGSMAGGEDSSGMELTPAASEALDLSADSFRHQVLQELSRTHRSSDYRIRVSDVQQAVSEIPSGLRTNRSSMYLLISAVLLCALSLVSFTITAISSLHGAAQAWAISGAGLLIGAACGGVVVLVVQEHTTSGTSLSREFLRQASALEASARQAAGKVLGEQAENSSLSRIISVLELLEIWTPEDSQAFRKLLSLRNKIVHEDYSSLPPKDITFGVSQAARLLSLIHRRMDTGEASQGRIFWKLEHGFPDGIAFEERVSNALRKASFHVLGAQQDRGYDLLVETPSGSVMVIAKYKESGDLVMDDVRRILSRQLPNINLAIVTNAQVSYAVRRFLSSSEIVGRRISVISWQPRDPDTALAESIAKAAAREFSDS
jgi:hypothetical protein